MGWDSQRRLLNFHLCWFPKRPQQGFKIFGENDLASWLVFFWGNQPTWTFTHGAPAFHPKPTPVGASSWPENTPSTCQEYGKATFRGWKHFVNNNQNTNRSHWKASGQNIKTQDEQGTANHTVPLLGRTRRTWLIWWFSIMKRMVSDPRPAPVGDRPENRSTVACSCGSAPPLWKMPHNRIYQVQEFPKEAVGHQCKMRLS